MNLFPDRQEHRVGANKEQFIRSTLVPLASVVIAALGLFAKDVPPWITWLGVVFIAVVLVAILGDMFKTMMRKWKENRLTRKVMQVNLPEMRRYISELSETLDESRADTPFYVLKQASALELQHVPVRDSRDRIVQRVRVNTDSQHLHSLWLGANALLAGNLTSDTARFERLCDLGSRLVLQYQRFCESALEGIAILARDSEVPENSRRSLIDEWELVRDRQNNRVRQWESIAKRVNSELGKRLCGDYFPVLKGLH